MEEQLNNSTPESPKKKRRKWKVYYTMFPVNKTQNFEPESLVGETYNNLLVVKNLGMQLSNKNLNNGIDKTKDTKIRYYLCKCTECGKAYEVKLNRITRATCENCSKAKPD